MCARNPWVSGWFWCVALLPMSMMAAAQCAPDVFLTIGSQQPAVPIEAPAPPAALLGAAAVIRLTEAQILSLPVSVITTGTDWTSVSRFEGPLLSDVLKLPPGRTGHLEVLALNRYGVTIPVSDLARYSPILAHTRDGVRMKRSDFGPLFIVYPRDRYRELRAPNMAARMVWQVCRIDVE